MSADTKIKLCLWESRDRQNIKLARPSFILSLCSLPLKTLAEFCLMNQSIRWRLWLVNISGQLWPICGIQVLLIGQGSSQHISAILDYAHDLLSVVNGWLSLPRRNPMHSPFPSIDYSDIKLRPPKIQKCIYSWLAMSRNPDAMKKLFENHSVDKVKKLWCYRRLIKIILGDWLSVMNKQAFI